MKVIEGYRLFKDKYLVVFDECLAIATVNDKGEIIRVSTFGERQVRDERLSR